MLVNNQKKQSRVHKRQGDCCQWKAIGKCSEGNCSFWHDTNKRAKPTTQPKSQDVKNAAKAKSS